jgi:IS1 family transposase/transposase-like protein
VDTRTSYCRNPKCQSYGQTGRAAQLHAYDTHRQAPRFRCGYCGQLVSARAGTAYAGIRTPETIYRLGAKLLAEGMSIRAAARILEVDKDTVCQWVPRLGQHSMRLAAYYFRALHITECQLDELWTFVYKKEAQLDPVDQIVGLYGDAWVWIAFAPECKLVVAWVVGKRTLHEARRLINHLKTSLDGHLPFFTSDNLPHYADALLDEYGEMYQPPKRDGPGRPPLPYKVPPENLLYAVVVKRRENGRVVEVSTEVVYGSPQRIAALLRHSATMHVISTYGVERNNLTIRQHSRRMTRRVNAFSKDRIYLKYQLALAFADYHFAVPHRGLRQRLETPQATNGPKGSPKKWRERTPAMAAGLTDHVWTIDELLSFRVPPKYRW